MTNTQVREQLEQKYLSVCMLGGTVTFRNPLTMHHIEEKKNGGPTNLENGSLACHLEHSGVHILSDDDKYKRRRIIEYLKEYKHMLDIKDDPFYMKVAFHTWLEQEVMEMGYIIDSTKDNLLIFKKSPYKVKSLIYKKQ